MAAPQKLPVNRFSDEFANNLPPLRRLVFGARLARAAASARAPRKGAGESGCAAHRTHRGGQDARRISADACRSGAAGGPARPSYALYLAAEGARGRRETQSRNADRRNGPAASGRNEDRRHAGFEAAKAAPRSARHSADHARAARSADRERRRKRPFRRPSAASCSTSCTRSPLPNAAIF